MRGRAAQASLLTEPVAAQRLAGTLALVVLALCWLSLSIWLLPHRAAHPKLVLIFYVGLLAISVLLVTRSPAFFAFSRIGYPYAFALFSAHWILIAVTATAIGQYVILIALGVPNGAGAVGYLLKDAPTSELLESVRAAAEGKSVLSPSLVSRLMGRSAQRPAR